MLSVGVFLVLVSLMTLGVGGWRTGRSAAGTLTTAFLLLMGLPLMLAMTGVGPLVSLSAADAHVRRVGVHGQL